MTILDQIVATKRAEVATLYQNKNHWAEFSQTRPRTRRFQNAIASSFGVIAEIKKASPSKGIIRPDFNPVQIARSFEKNGATALSVLTDVNYFQGSPRYIQEIRPAVNIPILRKEFIIDPIQIWESVFLGADAILLIKAILDQDTCQQLINTAHNVGLDILLEVHSPSELDDALRLRDIDLMGINNRNLATFETDTNLANTLNRIIKETHPTLPVVAESGYQTINELAALKASGFAGVLIGEGLARNPNLEKSIATLSMQ